MDPNRKELLQKEVGDEDDNDSQSSVLDKVPILEGQVQNLQKDLDEERALRQKDNKNFTELFQAMEEKVTELATSNFDLQKKFVAFLEEKANDPSTVTPAENLVPGQTNNEEDKNNGEMGSETGALSKAPPLAIAVAGSSGACGAPSPQNARKASSEAEDSSTTANLVEPNGGKRKLSSSQSPSEKQKKISIVDLEESDTDSDIVEVDAAGEKVEKMIANQPHLQLPKTYCYCNDVAHGKMIACDSKKCPYEWYHFGCVNLTRKPKGNWYCLFCST